MGQRLVAKIRFKDQDIASIYYHWSAYTISALEEALSIVQCAEKCKTVREMQLSLIRMVEANGGGIYGGKDGAEFKYIQGLFPRKKFKEDGYSRTYGLIALTEEGMEDLLYWAEGVVEVDFDSGIVYNDVFFSYDYDEYKREMEDAGEKAQPLEQLEDIGMNISVIEFGELEEVIRELVRMGTYTFRNGHMIYELIA